MVLVFVALAFLCPSHVLAQIDLFGHIAETLDYQWRHAPNPWERTRVYDIGWNVNPTAVRFEYVSVGNPLAVLVAIPNTSQSFTNTTTNAATYPYEALCKLTVNHTWKITYGMSGNLIGTFNSLPGIDPASPDSGSVHLTQGESAQRDAQYSQILRAAVSIPGMTSATYQAYYEERPVTVPFEVDVRIGGSFRFEAFRGNTRAQMVQGLGTFYKLNPHSHVQVIDDQFVIVKLQGEYKGAIGRTPGNFTCEAVATP
jgi:hypothetical protein